MVHVLLKPGLENFEHYFISPYLRLNEAMRMGPKPVLLVSL